MAQTREVVASEMRRRIDRVLRSVRYDGGRSAGECLGAEIQRPAAFTGSRAGMAIVDAKARGRSPCGAETRERERDAEFDLAHENAPVSSRIERIAQIGAQPLLEGKRPDGCIKIIRGCIKFRFRQSGKSNLYAIAIDPIMLPL
jgi:hypothetical protein